MGKLFHLKLQMIVHSRKNTTRTGGTCNHQSANLMLSHLSHASDWQWFKFFLE